MPGGSQRGRRLWIVVTFFNALPFFFGSSYIWWPSQDVLRANGTEGLLHINRYAWGALVMILALTMLAVAIAGLRRRKAWAWKAAWFDIVFFSAVAAIEPDYFFPVLFGLIIIGTLLFSSRWFFPEANKA